MKNKHDVIVVGAGMVGVSTAIHLLKRGRNVLLLDKRGIAQETSYGNSGIIESSYVLPFAPPHWKNIPAIMLGLNPYARISYPDGISQIPWMLRFYWESRKTARSESGAAMRPLVENAVSEHESIMRAANASQYISDQGRIKLHRSQQSFKNAAYERKAIKEYGVPFDILSAKELQEIEPDIKPNFHTAIRLKDSKRYTNPAKAIQSAAKWFVEQGGTYQTQSVTSLHSRHGQWHVNEHTADNIVICAGPWSNQLLKPLGHNFPLGVKRGYHQHFKSNASLNYALVDADEGYLICPMEQGMRITTGAEFANMDTKQNPIQIAQALPKAREIIDIGEQAEEGAWIGTRPCTPDSLPIIGESSQHKGLWFNLGHGHCGITAGPASARLTAELITNEKPFCDPLPYSAERFKR